MMDIPRINFPNLLTPTGDQRSDLDRAIAAAAGAHDAMRRRLALVVAEEMREERRRAGLLRDARELETRAIEALGNDREDLARRAADTIASIETEVAASEAASVRFQERARLVKRDVDGQRRRLAELDHRRRFARLGAAFDPFFASPGGPDPFDHAEAALARLEADRIDAEALRRASCPAPARDLIEELSEAGFGRPSNVRAEDVLRRLRGLAAPSGSHPEA